MRLVFLSDSDYMGGGGVAAATLGRAIAAQIGVFDWIMLRSSAVDEPWRRHFLPPMTEMPLPWRGFARVAGATWRDTATVRSHLYNRWIHRLLRGYLTALRPDVIQVHGLHVSGWDFGTLELCHEFAPVVYTFHDFWHTTARCMYPFECRQFESGCTATCPTADQHPRLHPAKIHNEWVRRKRAVSRCYRLKGVAVSEYIRDETVRGAWRSAESEVIRNGVDVSRSFLPLDVREARTRLGLPHDRPILLISALSLRDPRKGYHLFQKALAHLSSKKYIILAFGNDTLGALVGEPRIRYLGYLASESEKRIAYAAADWTVVPSLAETLCMVAVESIACGTPVVSFSVGGLPEVVIPGRSGLLAGQPSVDSLTECLNEALRLTPVSDDLRISCRKVAEERFDVRRAADQYVRLYRRLVASSEAL